MTPTIGMADRGYGWEVVGSDNKRLWFQFYSEALRAYGEDKIVQQLGHKSAETTLQYLQAKRKRGKAT